jgi:hypothetical protein
VLEWWAAGDGDEARIAALPSPKRSRFGEGRQVEEYGAETPEGPVRAPKGLLARVTQREEARMIEDGPLVAAMKRAAVICIAVIAFTITSPSGVFAKPVNFLQSRRRRLLLPCSR